MYFNLTCIVLRLDGCKWPLSDQVHTLQTLSKLKNKHLISLYSGPLNLVPCSNMAGEVVSVGKDVKDEKAGDCIYVNFVTGHLFYRNLTVATIATGVGGQCQVLLITEASTDKQVLTR